MSRQQIIKLTSLSSCAGCAAKLSQKALSQVLRRLPKMPRDPNLLVGSATADDAGIYRIDRDLALVQTVDFFTPIVDDPFLYGQIAAANALSDVYAMGGRPLTALNILGVPEKVLSQKIIADILRGGLAKASQADCAVVGGHTIRSLEPIFGLAVTGLVSPRQMITNAAARAGDLLILTKPLGTGIITTGIKRNLTPNKLMKQAVASMCELNSVGAILAERGLVRAGTDVTGFGLLGHLGSLCRASGVGAEIDATALPVIAPEVLELIAQDCIPGGTRDNLETASKFTRWQNVTAAQKILCADAQTSGGLMLCVPPRHQKAVAAILRRAHTLSAALIGRIVRSSKSQILVRG